MQRDYYAGDPHWTTCRYPTKCAGCQAPIKKGDQMFYYPKGKSCYGKSCHCGDDESSRFNRLAEAEYAYNHGGY